MVINIVLFEGPTDSNFQIILFQSNWNDTNGCAVDIC